MNYQFLRKISQGGFSEVFEIRDPASAIQETLILKRLSPEMSALPAVRRAFTREGQILSNLRHPNIVTFRRCFYEQGHICLVMEKVEGEDLKTWAFQNRGNPEQVIDVFRQILEAVDHLHHRSTPLLHLDLKPENILIHSRPGGVEPVLVDFGIARDMGGQGLKAYTPPYAAPEQERGGSLGCYTDVYALGQVFDELLQVLRQSLSPRYLEAFRGVATRARAKSRRRRYADAGEMLQAFRQTRASTMPQQGRKLPPAVVPAVAAAAVVGILVVASLVGWLAGSRDRGVGTEIAEPTPVVVVEPQPLAPQPIRDIDSCVRFGLAAADFETVSQELDACIEKALQSNKLAEMDAQYRELKQLLGQGQIDAETEKMVKRKMLNLEREIDIRTSPLLNR